MNTTNYILIPAAAVVVLALFTGCATRGKALRPTTDAAGAPITNAAKADAYYIESAATNGQKPFSCSFVEFDERGDYLDFKQHRAAYTKIRSLAETNGERLLVVTYVHGWKNNSQSGDVVEFNSFLERLSTSPLVVEGGYRVHGVFLGWRGNAVKHALDTQSDFYTTTLAAYGEPIVNLGYARGSAFGWLLKPFEALSYWSRKNAAEDKVSGVSLIRTIFTVAHTARRFTGKDHTKPNLVFLMGHSFGALMLEQSFAPATLSRLTEEWPWDDEERTRKASANPLPFDLVMFVNSAAPSIYAKQLHGYFVAHRGALAANGVIGADAPLIISLTTAADSATGKVHPIGNFLAPLYPSLWRKYDGDDFVLKTNAANLQVPQAYYYRRTPGHNPLLVNHWIVPAPAAPKPNDHQSLIQQNMDPNRKLDVTNRVFHTSPRKTGGKTNTWHITTTPSDPKWSTYKGVEPACLGGGAVYSGYWIMRCTKEIMRGHNDIWSLQAMETYAALFREAVWLREQKPAGRRRTE